MAKMIKLGLVALAMGVSAPALAAPTITFAEVRGSLGSTVWDTAFGGYYTLFVQKPYGTNLNPNDEALAGTLPDAENVFTTAGDGWPTNSKFGNSDPAYNLILTLTEGSKVETLTGSFSTVTGIFTATSSPVRFGALQYELSDFNWLRGLNNIVGSHTVASAGNSTNRPVGALADYQGAFTVTAGAVPEPATWGLMILGFGMVGGVMRRRRVAAKVAFG